MIMLWLLSMWERAGCPFPINFIELGPGTGVMMVDMLRVIILFYYKKISILINNSNQKFFIFIKYCGI